jgi:DNA-3-methyladenine glycosylase II
MSRAVLYQQATTHLSTVDGDLGNLIAQIGECQIVLKPEQEPYQSLIRAIAYQQIHGKAAAAILGRFLAMYADSSDEQFPSAMQIVQTDDLDIRACGFSERKTNTIKGIAQAALEGMVPSLTEAHQLSDEALIARLTTLKGIGRWTVEMFLMFNLGRHDVWPVDDFGVRQGYKKMKRLEEAPTPKQLKQIGAAYAPYRSIAAWYLWRATELD